MARSLDTNGEGTYTKLARNNNERETTYLVTFLLGDLASFEVGLSVVSRVHSCHVVLERTNATDTAQP